MIQYIEEKIWLIVFYILFVFLQFIFNFLVGLKISLLLPLFLLSLLLLFLYLFFDYWRINKRSKEIKFLVDNLEEKYLICEVIKKP